MQVAINDHAQAISGVQGELKRKANEKIVRMLWFKQLLDRALLAED